jgi:predicted nucleic acid-binding protein
MLLIYLLEGHPTYRTRVEEILTKAYERNDELFTSYLVMGEIMSSAAIYANPATSLAIRSKLDGVGFSYLEFGEGAVTTFSRLRAVSKVKAADSINLACAAAGKMDLFLTGDRQLLKLSVPGIHFIADFENPIL